LIVNPAVEAVTGISVPVAIVFAGVAVFDGRLLFILPTIFLVVLGSLSLFLFVIRLYSRAQPMVGRLFTDRHSGCCC
jgi:hypothetical protein